jgi:hypothetical protein
LLGTASSNPLSKAKNQSPTNPINIHLRYILELHWMIRKMQKTVKKQEKPSKSDFYGFYVVFTLFSRCFSESRLEISHFSDFTYPYPWIFYFPAFYRYK